MNYEKLKTTYEDARWRICEHFPKLSRLAFNTHKKLSDAEENVIDRLEHHAASELGCVFVPLGEESPLAVPDIPDIPCVPDDPVDYTEYI